MFEQAGIHPGKAQGRIEVFDGGIGGGDAGVNGVMQAFDLEHVDKAGAVAKEDDIAAADGAGAGSRGMAYRPPSGIILAPASTTVPPAMNCLTKLCSLNRVRASCGLKSQYL